MSTKCQIYVMQSQKWTWFPHIWRPQIGCGQNTNYVGCNFAAPVMGEEEREAYRLTSVMILVLKSCFNKQIVILKCSSHFRIP